MENGINRSTVIRERIRKTDITNYERTEIGLGRLFIDIYGDEIKFVPQTGQFYLFCYTAGVWKKCSCGMIENLVVKFLSKSCELLLRKISDAETRKKYRKWIQCHQTNAAISSIVKCIKREKKIEVSECEFDRLPRYFGLKNGVLDLETQNVIKGKKEYLVTRQANVYYDKDVKDETWTTFIHDIDGEGEDGYTYKIRTIAYAMQGNPSAHCLFVLYGRRTRNGKSTFINGLSYFFGDYSRTLQPESLSRNRVSKAGSANPDIAKLRGARFVNIAEADSSLKFDVPLVKTLTGQDRLNVRALYKDYEEFVNTAVFFLHVNRLPKVEDATLFTSNRVIVMQFNQYFDVRIADPYLAAKLTKREALSGLLNEIIRIMKEYKGVTIKECLPQTIVDATTEYEKESDLLGWFLKSKLKPQKRGWIEISFIYKEYVKQATHKNQAILSQRSFTIELKVRGYDIIRRKSGNGLTGYRIYELD